MNQGVGKPQSGTGTAAVLVIALVGQSLVAFSTFIMGLGWGGVTYLLGLAQATVAFVVILLMWRRTPLVVLVPLVSLLLTIGLALLGDRLASASACTDELIAAGEEIAPPPGGEHTFEGEAMNGCIARYSVETAPTEVTAHYVDEFQAGGWTLRSPQSSDGVAAEKDGIVLDVLAAGELEGGLVIVTVFEKPDHWE